MAFRLVLEDVSAEMAPATADGASVRLQLRHSLPVFVEPQQTAAPPQLELAACGPDAPRACVRVRNPGAIRAKVLRIDAETPGGWKRTIAASSTVLAGSWRQWEFKDAPQGGELSVRVETTAGVLMTPVPPARP